MKPATQYTKSGRINIAYQVFGSGPVDLVYIPGWVSNIDWMWACPELVNFLQELGKNCRVILFDKRGTGLSDRIVELSSLEARMDDIRAVMDAIGSQKAVLFGHSEGGSVSALFAATYPNRTIALITFGVFAKRRYAPEYPWAPTDEERQKVYDTIEKSWGSGDMNLESLAPSKAHDKVFMEWLANYFRSGASPSAAMVLTRMNTEVDIIDILGSIKVPTLIMQRTHDIDVKIEEGRFIAERIPGAIFREFDGSDHLFWAGNTEEVLTEMISFIANVKPAANNEERLYTIMAAKLIQSEVVTGDSKELINQYVSRYRGKIVFFDHQNFIAIFEGPSKAAHCAADLRGALRDVSTNVSVGVHIKEGVVTENHLVSESIRELFLKILLVAEPGQILITQAVKYLLSGAGLNFIEHSLIKAPDSGESILLFRLKDQQEDSDPVRRYSPRHDSFLDSVLQVVDDHLGDETFGVDRLCREVGMSERQLQRKLKAITNKSPNQMISSVRLHRAKELLMSDPDLNIAEIAFQTGFANPSYFSKRFRKEFWN